MATTFSNSLNSDPSSDFLLIEADCTESYPGEGIDFVRPGGGGTYTDGIYKLVPLFVVPGMYVQWGMRKTTDNGNSYSFAGIRKTPEIDATGCYGVYFSSPSRLECITSGTAISTSVTLDQWYTIKLLFKDDDTFDVYADGVFIANQSPGVTFIGQPLYLQLAAPFYGTTHVGYKDVIWYDPRNQVDTSDFSTSSGWTSDDTLGAASFDGEYHQTKTTSNGWGSCGVWRTAPTQMALGDLIHSTMYASWSSQPESIIWLRSNGDDDVSTGTEGVGFNLHQSAGNNYIIRQNAAADTDIDPFSQDPVLYDLAITCTYADKLDIWAKENGDIDWTHLGTTTVTGFAGNSYYFSASIWANGTTLNISEYSWNQVSQSVAVSTGNNAIATVINLLNRHYGRMT